MHFLGAFLLNLKWQEYYAIQGSALILHVRILVARVYIGKYLQLQHAVSIPEKISICLLFPVKVSVYQYLLLDSSHRENVDSPLRVDDYRNFPKFSAETRLECVWKNSRNAQLRVFILVLINAK